MHGDLFDSTIPFGEPELIRVSAYRRYLDDLAAEAALGGRSSRIGTLSPSMRADLYRFEQQSGSTEAVEVLAACVRHAKRLTIHFECGERVVPLTVFPQEGLVHCPMPMEELTGRNLPGLRVMHVEPALLHPPGDSQQAMVGEARLHHPLAPLLWELAMRGQRRELLPEITGPAAYRVAPALDIAGLPASGALKASMTRLRSAAATLNDIAGWPGLDRERATRLLNALYLQAGLIVSRSHPDAVRESWFGGL
jgi:hypothetical protein